MTRHFGIPPRDPAEIESDWVASVLSDEREMAACVFAGALFAFIGIFLFLTVYFSFSLFDFG